MQNIKKDLTFGIFLLIFVLLLFYNINQGSQWVLDASLAILLLIIFYFIDMWLDFGVVLIILFNLGLIVHNLGSFGFYSLSFGLFEYDNFVHVFSSFAAGYIIISIIAKKFHYRSGILKKKTVVDDHKALAVLLVISFVISLGVFVELTEFIGYAYLGVGDGLFFYGSGDLGAGLSGEYIDVMTDIIANIIGAIIGVLAYYLLDLKRFNNLHFIISKF